MRSNQKLMYMIITLKYIKIEALVDMKQTKKERIKERDAEI